MYGVCFQAEVFTYLQNHVNRILCPVVGRYAASFSIEGEKGVAVDDKRYAGSQRPQRVDAAALFFPLKRVGSDVPIQRIAQFGSQHYLVQFHFLQLELEFLHPDGILPPFFFDSRRRVDDCFVRFVLCNNSIQ